MSNPVDITGLDKAEVLHALYHGTAALGMGVLHDRRDFTVEDARAEIAARPERWKHDFDYLAGRPLKLDIGGDSFDPRLYDRDSRRPAADVIAELREYVRQREERIARGATP